MQCILKWFILEENIIVIRFIRRLNTKCDLCIVIKNRHGTAHSQKKIDFHHIKFPRGPGIFTFLVPIDSLDSSDSNGT